MSVSIQTTPLYPAPKRKVKLRFETTGGDQVRLAVTDAPRGSELKAKLDKEALTQLDFFNGDTGTEIEYIFDIGGRYVFKATEMRRRVSQHGGGYEDDPAGSSTNEVIDTNTVTVVVGSRVTVDIAVGAYGKSTLVLYAFDETVRETTELHHGEKSPALVNPNTAIAKTAVVEQDVTDAIAALKDQLTATLIGSIAGVVNEMISKLNAHMGSATFHSTADTNNAIDAVFVNPTTPGAIQRTAAEVYRKLKNHFSNDTGEGQGEGSGSYHSAADWEAMAVSGSGGSLAIALVQLADAWRGFEAHRSNGTLHATPDTVNSLSSLPPLLDLYRLLIDHMRVGSPTTPNTENKGKVELVHGAGFTG